MNKIVWITGASSGLGLHTAKALQKQGYRVAAGARSFDRKENHVEGCLCLPLDVTKGESIAAFADSALSAYGPPDILVNCAGVLCLGACECYEADEIRRILEVNFLGMTRMIAKALPHFREKGKGRIINFSSINGVMGIPFQGAYTASKHAIEGYSECLQLECKKFGVEVMVVRPGDHQSGASAYRSRSRGMGKENPYAQDYETACGAIAWDEGHGSDPDRLGEKIARALKKKRLPRHICIASFDQHLAVLLHTILPARLFESIISSHYRKTKD